MTHLREVPLVGGNSNPVVVRIGDTVRRSVHSWSPTVHGLLRHLEAKGFEGSPRFLGIDEKGREVLTYLPGEVGFMPYLWESNQPLVAAAHLLRSYHEATLGYTPPKDACWQFVYPDAQGHEVICHNDFAPYNWVCADQRPYAVIDFDLAGPGPRLRDIAYAAYWLAPLTFNASDLTTLALSDLRARSSRLRLFCETYGVAATPELLGMVEEVLQFLGDWLEVQAESGNPACCKMIEDGHLAGWRNELAAFRQQRPLLERNL